MPSVIAYDVVDSRMQSAGLRCLYHNSGAFGLPPGTPLHATGWIGPEDPTIRPAAQALTKSITPPFEKNLANLATSAWLELFPGPAWLMPKSHWSYELDFGSKSWMPDALVQAGFDPAVLASLNNAAALEFLPSEAQQFSSLVETLLSNLLGSDFTIAFPDWPVVCTLHHHKQLWWMAGQEQTVTELDRLLNAA